MAKVHVEAAEKIDARPESVYAVLADYRTGHPAIVPKPYFSDIVVEQGGQGAGTVIRFSVTVNGMVTQYHGVVSEPQPGRVLAETYDSGQVTSFIVEPIDGGQHTQLTITTDFNASPGLRGLFERWLSPRIMTQLFRQEIQQVANYVRR